MMGWRASDCKTINDDFFELGEAFLRLRADGVLGAALDFEAGGVLVVVVEGAFLFF